MAALKLPAEAATGKRPRRLPNAERKKQASERKKQTAEPKKQAAGAGEVLCFSLTVAPPTHAKQRDAALACDRSSIPLNESATVARTVA